MSDELSFDTPSASLPSGMDEMSAAEEEYEEITSEEVDRVVALLEELMETVESENIRSYLEEAMNNIYYLVYEDEDEDLCEEGGFCEEDNGEGDDPFSEAA